MVPPLHCAARWAVLEGLVDSICEAYTSIWDGSPGYVDAWASFLLGIMDSLVSGTHLATNQRMVSATVGPMVAADDENIDKQWSSSDDEIQLVPMILGVSRIFCGQAWRGRMYLLHTDLGMSIAPTVFVHSRSVSQRQRGRCCGTRCRDPLQLKH